MELTDSEKDVIVGMINTEQSDGAEWTVDGVRLNDLKTKVRR